MSDESVDESRLSAETKERLDRVRAFVHLQPGESIVDGWLSAADLRAIADAMDELKTLPRS